MLETQFVKKKWENSSWAINSPGYQQLGSTPKTPAPAASDCICLVPSMWGEGAGEAVSLGLLTGPGVGGIC